MGQQLLETFNQLKNTVREYFRQRTLCDTVDTNGDGVPDFVHCGGVVSIPPSGLQPIAVGLSRSSQHKKYLVRRFADNVGATTYWDLYSDYVVSNAEILARMTTQFGQRPIMVNLSGLEQIKNAKNINDGLRTLVKEPYMTITEGEIATILRNPEFFGRTRFFWNGKEVFVNQAEVLKP